ncbi:MAG: glycosyltransferase [Prevotella sp.]|nr:glycosyltransferase [Prevotella sp.]
MTPRISIIIPCYNSAQWVAETIQSVLSQTIEDWECIIVNDGSTDNSLEIIKSYAEKDNRIRYIDKKNEGVAIARNTAIASAQGEYILPLDADDLIAPTYVEKALKYFEEHPSTKLVYCEADFFGKREEHWELPEYNYQDFIYYNCIFCSAIYRREDFLKTKGYNSSNRNNLEDWDFLLNFLKEDDIVHRIPETLFFYRIHGDSRTKRDDDSLAKSRLFLILNHAHIYSKDFNRTAMWIGNTEKVNRLLRKRKKYRKLFLSFMTLSIILILLLIACVTILFS